MGNLKRRVPKEPEGKIDADDLAKEILDLAAGLKEQEKRQNLIPAPPAFVFHMRTTPLSPEEMKMMEIPKFLRRTNGS